MNRARLLVAVAAVGVAGADVIVSAVWPFPAPPSAIEIIAHVAVGAAWIGAGLVAWARRPELRIGVLMTAVGVAWVLTGDPWWEAPLPATLYYPLGSLTVAVAVHAVLAFPTGRLRSSLERAIVAAAYADVLLSHLLSALVWDPLRADCGPCARNLLLVHRSRLLADVANLSKAAIAVVLGL